MNRTIKEGLKERIQKHHEAFVLKHKDVVCAYAGCVLWGGCEKCAGLHHDHLEDCKSFWFGWMYACDEKDGCLDDR